MFISTLLETQPLPLQSEYRPAAFSFPQTAEKKEYDTRNNSKRHNGHFHAFLSPDENWNSSLAYHVPPPFQDLQSRYLIFWNLKNHSTRQKAAA